MFHRASSESQPLVIPENLRIERNELTIGTTVLGTGGFANVVNGELAPKPGAPGRDIKKVVAIKVMQKADVSRSVFMNLQNEINICSELRNQCIINTWGILESSTEIYIVMDLAKGGELFKYMKQNGLEDMPLVAPNFVAEVVLGLEYMHKKGVIHRDIKPENLLLTEEYHVKIADFGTVCRMDDLANNTFTGTANYVSPEVLTSSRASSTSDLWALGCIVFQLFVGRSPFQGDSQYLVMQAIKSRAFEFPPYFPPEARDLVDRLLQMDPTKRIGANGFSEIKKHPFFKSIDWSTLLTSSNVTHLNANHSKVWERFLFENEKVVYCSNILKKRHLSRKHRVLILTDYPRMFYIDPETDVQKGQVPWGDDLCAIAESESKFTVHTPDRDYFFNDSENRAALWVMKVNDLVKKSSKKGKK